MTTEEKDILKKDFYKLLSNLIKGLGYIQEHFNYYVDTTNKPKILQFSETISNISDWLNNLIDNTSATAPVEDFRKLKVYLKIPITTEYSGDLQWFDESKTHIVKGKEFCETDKYGDKVCVWYVSTTFDAVKQEDWQWLIEEIAECGCKPTTEEFCKKLFI